MEKSLFKTCFISFNLLTLCIKQKFNYIGLNTSKDSLYPAFLFLFFSYLFIMIINVGITILIVMNKNLHQPMYLLFCNLPLNDILANSIVVPRLLIDLMRPPSERLISYNQCVVQAYIAHLVGTTSHTVLMIMAYDRYVAISDSCAWGVAFVLVGVLLGLTTRLSRCRTLITNPYCDNASLFKLSCESVVINNIYGITFTVAVYVVVCLTSKNKSLNSKALKTCSTHLVVYLIMTLSGMTRITLHRFPQYTEYRKIFAVLFPIFPGSLNPIIYGVQSKDLQKALLKFCVSKKVLIPLI
uniref:G-protein coupled receptors family 1 profile domain-containing protein n=1 Tax=Maylandia zebra TaxID=106582 RepID=A0A3P9DFU1_9CICH